MKNLPRSCAFPPPSFLSHNAVFGLYIIMIREPGSVTSFCCSSVELQPNLRNISSVCPGDGIDLFRVISPTKEDFNTRN